MTNEKTSSARLVTDKKSKRKMTANAWQLVGLAMLSVVFLGLFNYIPMAGILFAFKDGDGSFNVVKDMLSAPWTLSNFTNLFRDEIFWTTFGNTISINLLLLLFNFPMPIIFALLLNEMQNKRIKKAVQTISTFPHFISWTVFGGIILLMTDMRVGVVNPILELLGLSSAENPVDLYLPQYFYPKIIIASIIKGVGWGSIIYVAAISGIDQSLYEASAIDGANRFKQMLHVTLPGIVPTILVYLLLNIANILTNSFEQFYVFQNNANLETTRVLATYMYDLGFGSLRKYSTATALSLFEGIISLVLVFSTNTIAKKTTGRGILY